MTNTSLFDLTQILDSQACLRLTVTLLHFLWQGFAVAVATAVYFLWPRLVAPFIGLVVLVALARIITTAHYLSDVLFSAYLGVFFTLSTKVWFERRDCHIFAQDAAAGDRLASEPAE